MTSEVNEPTRRLRREEVAAFFNRNGAQNFHSFRAGRRRPRCADRPMKSFSRDHLPRGSEAKYIFEQGQQKAGNAMAQETERPRA